MNHPLLLGAVVILSSLALAGSVSAPVLAHGTLDQSLLGSPACNSTDFAGFTSSTGPIRQEFVPAQPGLLSVDICVNVITLPTTVTVQIRQGTASSPGAVLGSGIKPVSATGFQWLHVDLATFTQVEPGTKHVIAIPNSATFQWRAKCGVVSGSCTGIDPDAYPPGVSTGTGGADFAFRTYAGTVAIPPPGQSDQELSGDPDCGPDTFRGFSSTASPARQEFVPAAGGLSAVDLCINSWDPSVAVNVNIRTGTATAPGALLKSGSASFSGSGFRWIRVAIDPVLPTTPGARYVIELPSSLDFQWRAKCGAVSGSCSSIDPDSYLPGVSNRAGGADFGFRTIAGEPASDAPEGVADQALAGDPDCGASEFRGFTTGAVSARQEFVPAAAGLSAVDLCLNVLDATALTVNIRAGTAALPGAILQTETRGVTATGFRWVRVTFAPVLGISPGTKYVIEVPTLVDFEWRAKCGSVAGACTTIDPDGYLPGVSNRASGSDFGFRTIAGPAPGLPIGVADQKLAGDPSCNASVFKGFVSTTGSLRQEFVPSTNVRGLDAVDVCVQIFALGTPVRVNIRTGTVGSPGPVIATVLITADTVGFQWLRLDLPNVVPTVGGGRYMIELPSTNTFQWRGTCAQVAGSCTSVDPDGYPPGGSNDNAIRDFGFRTIAGMPVIRFNPQVATDGVP